MIIRFLIIWFLFSFNAHARPKVEMETTANLKIENLQIIANNFNVPLWALIGILATEKGKIGQAIQNKNRTWDLGAFQINTIHINELTKIGISPESILTDANINALVATWLLSKHFTESQNIWEAIGNYHSKTPKFKLNYIKKVAENLLYLQNNNVLDKLLSEVNNGK